MNSITAPTHGTSQKMRTATRRLAVGAGQLASLLSALLEEGAPTERVLIED